MDSYSGLTQAELVTFSAVIAIVVISFTMMAVAFVTVFVDWLQSRRTAAHPNPLATPALPRSITTTDPAFIH